jgi:hypothetical protein
MPRTRTKYKSLNSGDILSHVSLPSTMAGVHFAGPEVTAGELFGGGSNRTAWAVEVAYSNDDGWEPTVAKSLADLQERGFRVIARIDYSRRQHIPPLDDLEALDEYASAFVRLHKRTGSWVKYFVVGNEGNIDDYFAPDWNRRTECLAGREWCDPRAHALAYRAVRRALVGETDAYVLLGAPSPGTDDHPARWMDGTEYLKAVLGYLHPSEVDGIALHAYAPESALVGSSAALAAFTGSLAEQIAVAEEAGYVSTPIFVTEMNQNGRPDPEFILGAYQWMDHHNRNSRQDIVAACWFVYHDMAGDWGYMALEKSPDALEALSVVGAYPPGR